MHCVRSILVASSLVGVLAACSSGPTSATTPPTAARVKQGFGVLVMAHGGDPAWNAAVEQAIAPMRAKYPVEIAFGMADATTIQSAVQKLESQKVQRIGVVRLFVSGESWYERTEQILGIKDGAPGQDPHAGHANHDMHAGHDMHGAAPAAAAHGGHSMAFFRVTSRAAFEMSHEGLVDAAGMGKVLADRARALSKDPSKEDVLVIAHGPADDDENTRWLTKLDERATVIKAAAPFRRVEVATLREDWPDKRVAAVERIRAFVERAKTEGGQAIVLPFRVQGFGPYAKVLEGLAYVSDGQGLIPHGEVSAWIEKQVEELAARPFEARR